MSCIMKLVSIIAIVFTGVHRTIAALHPMCHSVYNIGAHTEAGGQAIVNFSVARHATDPQVAIKTFTHGCYYEIEHTILATLTEKQNKNGGDTWFPKLYASCYMPGNKTCPSIVMEFLPRPFLFPRYSTSLSKLVDILHQLLHAVARLHDFGYSHNDLKAGNVRMTDTGVVKLIDFGFATTISQPLHCDCKEGTLMYTPPEMIQHMIEESHAFVTPNYNKPLSPIDARKLDSWPLGMMSFRMLTNTLLYDPKEWWEMQECTKNESLQVRYNLQTVGHYFYVKEILMGQTSRSIEEISLTTDYPIIDACHNFRTVDTVESRFKSQLTRFVGTEPARELQRDVAGLWTVVNGLLQFENSARSDVHDALKNPIFESFIGPAVIMERNWLSKESSMCA